MTDYSDKRGRYRGLSPADFAPGMPNPNNPQKVRDGVVYSRPAIRGQREAFRHTTSPKAPEPPPMPIAPPPEPLPSPEDYALPETYGTDGGDTDHEL